MIPEVGEAWKSIKTGIVLEILEVSLDEDNRLTLKVNYELFPGCCYEYSFSLHTKLFECYFRKIVFLPCPSCKNNTFNLLRKESKQVSKDMVDGYGSIIEDGKKVFSHLECRNCKKEFFRVDTNNKSQMTEALQPAPDTEFLPKGESFKIPIELVSKDGPNLGSLFVGVDSLDCPSCSDSETKYRMNSAKSKGLITYTCGLCGHSESRNE